MAFAVVVPGNHLDVLRLALEDLEPALVDEQVACDVVSKILMRKRSEYSLGKTQFLL